MRKTLLWRIMSLAILALPISTLSINSALADEREALPKDAKFVVQVDVNRFRETKLGKKVIDTAKRLADQELSRDGKDGFQSIVAALGFDPTEDLHHFSLIGSSFERPEKHLRAIARLRQTGNLEGLLLAVPGYQSTKLESRTIHEVNLDGVKAFGAIEEGASGDKFVVATTDRADFSKLFQRVAGASTSPSDRSRSDGSDAFLRVDLLELPLQKLDLKGPPARIAKLLSKASLQVTEDEDAFLCELRIDAADEKSAEQLQQLAQGAAAFVGLAASQDDDEELQIASELLEDLKVDRKEKQIRAKLRVPSKLVMQLLRDEFDLPL